MQPQVKPILRACILYVSNGEQVGVYVNGKLWRVWPNMETTILGMHELFLKRPVVADTWDYVPVDGLEGFEEVQNDLAISHSSIPQYLGPASHGLTEEQLAITNGQQTKKKFDPMRPWVKYIVWHSVRNKNGKAHFLTVFDRDELELELLDGLDEKLIDPETGKPHFDVVDLECRRRVLGRAGNSRKYQPSRADLLNRDEFPDMASIEARYGTPRWAL